MTYVSARTFYDLLGPQDYDMVTAQLNWRGPADMAGMLQPLKLAGAVVADFGIGTGPLSETFRRAGAARIIGLDGSQRYLDHCLKSGRAHEVHLCDLENHSTPVEDASVRLATASGLFAYMANPEPMIWELTRVTEPGGHIAINFHPSAGFRAFETLSAAFVRPGGTLHVSYHAAADMRATFDDCGADLVAEHFNNGGIQRVQRERPAPLMTQLYRMRGAGKRQQFMI